MGVRQWQGRPIAGQTLRCELGCLWSKTTCSKSSCSLNESWSETLIVSWKVITILRLDSEDEIRLQFAGVSWLRPGTCHLITLSSQNWFLSPRIINFELTEHWAPYFKWKLHILQETGGNLMFVFNVYTLQLFLLFKCILELCNLWEMHKYAIKLNCISFMSHYVQSI